MFFSKHTLLRPALTALCVTALVLLSWLPSELILAQDNSSTAFFARQSRLATQRLLLSISQAGQHFVTVGERGHIIYSDKHGDNWQQAKQVPVRTTLTGVHFINENLGWAVGHDAVILHSQDGGDHWTLQMQDPSLASPLMGVWFFNKNRGLAIGAYGLVFTTDNGGTHWQRQTIAQLEDEFGEFPHFNSITATAEGSLFIVGELGAIIKSDDQGISWTKLSSPSIGSFFNIKTFGAQGLLLVGLQGRAYLSENAGQSWQRLPTGNKNALHSSALNGENLVLVGLAGMLLSSQDKGSNFQTQIRADRKSIADSIFLPNGDLLLIGENGIKRYSYPFTSASTQANSMVGRGR